MNDPRFKLYELIKTELKRKLRKDKEKTGNAEEIEEEMKLFVNSSVPEDCKCDMPDFGDDDESSECFVPNQTYVPPPREVANLIR